VSQRNVLVIIDDLTGKELPAGSGETVRFSLDGSRYELDVDAKGAKKLRSDLAPYIGAGRKIASPRSAPTPRRTKMATDPTAVRAWAASNGLTVSNRGRIPARVIAQFEAAGN
jgi:hypothetical protein